MARCECGCGRDADLGNRFIKGHNRRGLASFTSNGKWSMNYDKCVECGRTDRRHSRDGYCDACIRRLYYNNGLEKKRDFLDGRWSKKYDVCVECGSSENRYASNGLCVLCKSKKDVRDVGGKNRNIGGWSWYYDKCKHCGTTDVPHAAFGYCEVCHKRYSNSSLGYDEVSCPVCGLLVGRLEQHIAMRSKRCYKHRAVYDIHNADIISLFSSEETSQEIANRFGVGKRRVLEVWHENFSDKEITDRGERIRISKISGENNYLFGTIPHTNITKLVPFTDKCGVYHVMRSSWEAKYAKYLDNLDVKWEYEKHKFKYYGVVGGAHYYFPDFYLIETNSFIEIKGYYSDFDQYKVEECARLHGLEIVVLQKQDLADMGINLSADL